MPKLATVLALTLLLASCASPHAATIEATPISTGSPTLIPYFNSPDLPTLIPDPVAFGLFKELMSTNNNCELPCWWGIFPGETEWSQAKEILSPVALQDQGFQPLENYARLGDIQTVFFNAPADVWESENFSYNYFQRYLISKDSQIIRMIWAPIGDDNQRFSLHNVIKRFGEPEKVMVRKSFFHDYSHTIYFSIRLYYSDKGIVFDYPYEAEVTETGFDANLVNAGCSNKGPSLFLWSPGALSSEELEENILQIYFLGGLAQILPLEQVTSFDPSSFVSFVSTNPDKCFEMNLPAYSNN